MTITLSKAPVDGKRPGDTFRRMGTQYRVIKVDNRDYWTESEFGREKWLTFPVLTRGKFDCDRDAMLHRMTVDLWANESDGDVESAEGYFSRLSNSPAELAEIRAAFEDDAPEGFAWTSILGRFLVREDSQGFVTVTEYRTDSALERDYEALRTSFYSDIDF